MWIFSSEPSGEVYKELLDLATKLCNEFILVRRQSYKINDTMNILLMELHDYQVEIKKQHSWPGTELMQGYADVFYFQLNDITKEILKKYSKSLYFWKNPMLFEDLCFLKEGRKPWIVTIAHERFGWVEDESDNEVSNILSIKGIKLEEIELEE